MDNWLVELDDPGDWRSIRQLCALGHDSRCRVNHQSELYAHGIPNFPPYSVYHASARMHLQHANVVDR